jgi:osmoprotectant transport system permease protein
MTSYTWENFQLQWEALPDRLGGHIALSMAALVVGSAISIPLGIYASRHPRLERAALTSASMIQTIPSLALLALMVFVFGKIGWEPALIALVLYSLLPMLRNTVTGLHAVDPAAIEAARGIGMTDFQMLRHVQLPLASPMILAGLRTATVWVVGLATIAQPVGATSLGNYIFTGLSTRNSVALLFGCFFSAALALILDGLVRQLEKAVKRRSRRRAAMIAGLLVAIGLSPVLLFHLAAAGQPGNGRPIVIGSKGFTEQYILADLIESRLRSSGIPTQLTPGLGSTILYEALRKGEVDVCVDYTGTLWANVLQRSDFQPPEIIRSTIAEVLQKRDHVSVLGSLGFSNNYAFVMAKEKAGQLGIRSIGDLPTHAASLRAATGMEFFERPEWRRVKELYGFDFRSKRVMEDTLMYGAVDGGQLDLAVAFSTDGRIDAYDLVILDDPRKALPPYEAVILLSPRAAADPKVAAALSPLLRAISDDRMRAANRRVDIDRLPTSRSAKILDAEIQGLPPAVP